MTPRHVAVFNGDADGLCAAHLLRRALALRFHERVTGLKREIALLDRVLATPTPEVDVFDLSLAPNRAALLRLLAAGARVRWFDHHAPGDLPQHRSFEFIGDLSASVCTALLVDRYLCERHGLAARPLLRRWAVAAAFGDNLAEVGADLARALDLPAADCARLQELGEALNYNSYGETPADVAIQPAQLFDLLGDYDNPIAFATEQPIVAALIERRDADLQAARAVWPIDDHPRCAIVVLPDAPWSRRVLGTYANELARRAPHRAHAVLRESGSGEFVVSLRAPLARADGAARLAQRFGGSGRAAAAGIDRLPRARFAAFASALRDFDWGS
jgi:hypothetical protein